MVDAWASQVQYRNHIQPIWDHLPDDVRGTFWQPPQRPQGSGLIVVASMHDLRKVHPRPAVFVEHGAGQTYIDNRTPAGYAGGPGRGTVRLFVCPNEEVAFKNRAAYPQARVVVAGSPWVEHLSKIQRRPELPAVSFHWNCRVSPEARTAWPHYQNLEGDFLGHGHPRMWGQLKRWWPTKGIEPVESFEDVIRRASVYVCDNSSTIYEAAAVGIPVVLLNAPWYRRNVWHGLRFWEHLPGPMVDRSEDVEQAIDQAAEWYVDREQTTRAVYGTVEGSAERAAAAILELLT